MLTTFADPRTDFVFKRIFGTEENKHLLVALLNHLLELEGDHRILDVTYLPPEQAPLVPEMKLSVVDVKCRDERGQTYVVEMQVLNVEAFEKRIIYNASKSYVMQLPTSSHYRELAPVVGVTVCDFVFWSSNGDGSTAASVATAGAPVPMLSRWRMQEQTSGARSLTDVQYCFLELPKYSAGAEPVSMIERWAYFFRDAVTFTEIPPALQDPPFSGALEVARMANFTLAEWDAYDREAMAQQDALGAFALARKEGKAMGEAMGEARGEARGEAKVLRRAARDLCTVMGIEWSAEHQAQVESMNLSELEALREGLLTQRRWPRA